MSGFYYKVAARIMMAIMAYATEEIAKVDSDFQNLIKNENLIVQWEVDKGGPTSYFEIKNGKFNAIRDQKHTNPDITILIKDGKTAIKVLRGSPEILQEEVDKGNVTVTGDENKIEQLRPILEIIRIYLKDLRE
ncbi:MAG: alkyl sulfatase C-terminal domain-containing protein [Promethearchaeota archaeon]